MRSAFGNLAGGGNGRFYSSPEAEAAAPAPAVQGRKAQRNQRRDAAGDPQERIRRLPQARLPRRDRRADRGGAPHEKRKPLLLFPQQGRNPVRLPRVLA